MIKFGRYLLAAAVALAIASPTFVAAGEVQLAQAKSDDASKSKSKASTDNPGKATGKSDDKGKTSDKGDTKSKGKTEAKDDSKAKAKDTKK